MKRGNAYFREFSDIYLQKYWFLTSTEKPIVSPSLQQQALKVTVRPMAKYSIKNGSSVDGSAEGCLRRLVQSTDLTFLMEAHDALSAAIAQHAGFKGLWASGLSISSALGYRDANEASWTDVVNVVERMADATSIPILVDGDSGFGNFNNARLAALKLFQRRAAGICLEDKGFPKMNSFVGNRHPLADVTEF